MTKLRRLWYRIVYYFRAPNGTRVTQVHRDEVDLFSMAETLKRRNELLTERARWMVADGRAVQYVDFPDLREALGLGVGQFPAKPYWLNLGGIEFDF